LVGDTVWRIKRRPVWNSWRQNEPPGRLLKAGWRRCQALALGRVGPLSGGPGIKLCRSPETELLGTDYRSGLETASPCRPRGTRWLHGERQTLESSKMKVPARHRAA